MALPISASLLGAAVFCAANAWVSAARAYRPFTGTDAAVVQPGELELELGPVGLYRESNERYLIAPALVVNYGLGERVEAVLEGQHTLRLGEADGARRSQLEDNALLLKTILEEGVLQGRTGPSVAIESGVLLPGPEKRVGAHLGGIVSLRWPALTLHLNAGSELTLPRRYEATFSLIIEGSGARALRPVAEMLVSREFGAKAFRTGLSSSLLVGLIYRAADSVSFDCALRGGRTASRQFEEELRAGFTWAFERAGR